MVVSGWRIPVSWLYQDTGYLYHDCIRIQDTCIMVVSWWRRWCRIPVSWFYQDVGYLYHGCIWMKDTCIMVVSGWRIPVSWLYQDTGYLHHGCIRMKNTCIMVYQDEEDDAGYLYHGRIWMKGMMEDTCIMVVSGWRGWWRIPTPGTFTTQIHWTTPSDRNFN